MCRMMTPFASEDTLHLEEVSENMFRGVTGSRNFFRSQEDEALLLLQRKFYEEILLISNFLMKKTAKNMKNRSLLAFRSINNVF